MFERNKWKRTLKLGIKFKKPLVITMSKSKTTRLRWKDTKLRCIIWSKSLNLRSATKFKNNLRLLELQRRITTKLIQLVIILRHKLKVLLRSLIKSKLKSGRVQNWWRTTNKKLRWNSQKYNFWRLKFKTWILRKTKKLCWTMRLIKRELSFVSKLRLCRILRKL